MLWREEVKIKVLSYSRNHIDVLVDGDRPWRLTRVYGCPEVSLRKYGWELLRLLSREIVLPWVVFGDFNEVMDQGEVMGRRERDMWKIDDFRAAVHDCGLREIQAKGVKYTYTNKWLGGDEMRVKLDRALANNAWLDIWPNAEVIGCQALTSDHNPIVAKIEGVRWDGYRRGEGAKGRRRGRYFKFEQMWLRSEECKRVVERAWEAEGDRDVTLKKSHEECQEAVQAWNRIEFGNVQYKHKEA